MVQKKRTIKIGSVSFPLEDYAIVGNAVLGIRGSGKTYLAKSIAEQMLEAEIPIVVFDPIGQWRYLRRSASASGKGFKIVVAGGQEPDLPLTPATAVELTRAAIAENIPLVIDLYDHKLSKSDWRRIVRDCFRTLLYENKGVRHVFLEETAEFAPQKVFDNDTYAEVEKLVRMGGNASVGVTLINQRAQEVNKAVLDLCDNLVLMRQRGAHAIDALNKWLEKIEPEHAKRISHDMPTMKTGEAWVFQGDGGSHHIERVHALRSFHPDRKRPELTKRAGKVVNISEFVKRMEPKLSEKAKPIDVEGLKRRIKELERSADTMRERAPSMLDHGAGKKLSDLQTKYNDLVPFVQSFKAENKILRTELKDVASRLAKINSLSLLSATSLAKLIEGKPEYDAKYQHKEVKLVITAEKPKANGDFGMAILERNRKDQEQITDNLAAGLDVVAGKKLGKGEMTVLKAIAQHRNGVTETQIAVLTGYKATSRYTFLKHLKAAHLIRETSGSIHAEPAAFDVLGPSFTPLPEGDELRAHWLEELGGGEKELFRLLVEAYPQTLTEAELMQTTGYRGTSVYTFLKHLKARQIVLVDRKVAKAADELFT